MKNIQYIFIMLLMGIFSCTSAQESNLKTYVAYNDIVFKYELILPQNYNKDKDYEVALLFTETALVDNEWTNALSVIKEDVRLNNTILVIPKVPLKNEHWKSHPIHHALNAMMDYFADEYELQTPKFHFIGYKAGQDAAQTYSSMSRQYIKSYSVIQGGFWKDNKQEWFDTVINYNIPVYIYENTEQKNISLNISKSIFERSSGLSDALNKIDSKMGGI